MIGEIISSLDLHVVTEIHVTNSANRVVHLSPYSTSQFPRGKPWPSLQIANHNVFLLDPKGKVVWQVARRGEEFINWEVRHQHAKEADPDCEGFYDPFWELRLDESGATTPEPVGIYRPGCKVYLKTQRWLYELDVEKGIATCTGDQLK